MKITKKQAIDLGIIISFATGTVLLIVNCIIYFS